MRPQGAIALGAPDVPERPELKPWYRLATDGARAVLEYGERAVVLEGAAATLLLPVLLPLLDGRRTVAEIVAQLGAGARPAVENAVRMLSAHGLLGEGPPLPPETAAEAAEAARFLAATTPGVGSAAELHAQLVDAAVGIAGSSSVADDLARLVHRSGIGHVARVDVETLALDPGHPPALVVVAPSAAELTSLTRWNERALATRTPWLQLLPFNGRLAAVGPLFLPGESCCHDCFLLRRHSSLDLGDDFWRLERTPSAAPVPAFVGAVCAGLAATLVLRWCAYRDRMLPGRFYALEPRETVEVSRHTVYRVPRCPSCSDVEDRASPLPWFKVNA